MKKVALNGMRGLMAIAILLSHCGYLRQYEQTKRIGEFLVGLWGAVTFFFILSGFFFYYSKKNETFKKFISRKIKKIYPIHFLTLICSLCLLYLQERFSIKENGIQFLINLLLLQAWIPEQSYYFSFNAVSWFLSGLLACYCFTYYIKKKSNLFWIVLVGYALQVLMCITMKETHHWLLYINPIFRIVDFCFGICICQGCEYYKHKKIKVKWIYTASEIISISLFVVAVLLVGTIKVNWTYNCIWVIPVACIIISFSIEKGIISNLLKMQWIQKIGDISMELFMTHKFVINYLVNVSWFMNLAEKNAFLSLLLIVSLCIELALIIQWLMVSINLLGMKIVRGGKRI